MLGVVSDPEKHEKILKLQRSIIAAQPTLGPFFCPPIPETPSARGATSESTVLACRPTSYPDSQSWPRVFVPRETVKRGDGKWIQAQMLPLRIRGKFRWLCLYRQPMSCYLYAQLRFKTWEIRGHYKPISCRCQRIDGDDNQDHSDELCVKNSYST